MKIKTISSELSPRAVNAEATRVQGELIRDVLNSNLRTFRIFSPDETNSNHCNAVFEVTEPDVIRDRPLEHKQYIEQHGEDMPEIRNWKWSIPQ